MWKPDAPQNGPSAWGKWESNCICHGVCGKSPRGGYLVSVLPEDTENLDINSPRFWRCDLVFPSCRDEEPEAPAGHEYMISRWLPPDPFLTLSPSCYSPQTWGLNRLAFRTNTLFDKQNEAQRISGTWRQVYEELVIRPPWEKPKPRGEPTGLHPLWAPPGIQSHCRPWERDSELPNDSKPSTHFTVITLETQSEKYQTDQSHNKEPW